MGDGGVRSILMHMLMHNQVVYRFSQPGEAILLALEEMGVSHNTDFFNQLTEANSCVFQVISTMTVDNAGLVGNML